MTAEHWEAAYQRLSEHSWDQDLSDADLGLLGEAGIGTADSIVDVGGGDGASTQTLLARGHRDLTRGGPRRQRLERGRRTS